MDEKYRMEPAQSSTDSTPPLRWFRLHAEFATDPDIQSLAFEDQRHFVVLLCLKATGVLDKDYPTEDRREAVIARALGLDRATAREAKARLSEAGLIAPDWQPKNWDKRQYASDNATTRWRKWKDKKDRQRWSNVGPTVPESETETESKSKDRGSRRAPPVDNSVNTLARKVMDDFPHLEPATKAQAMKAVNRLARGKGRGIGRPGLESGFRAALEALSRYQRDGQPVGNVYALLSRVTLHEGEVSNAQRHEKVHEAIREELAKERKPPPGKRGMALLADLLAAGVPYDQAVAEAEGAA